MRIHPDELDAKIKNSLRESSELSKTAESILFTKAHELLLVKRQRISQSERKSFEKLMKKTALAAMTALYDERRSSWFEKLALYPDQSAMAVAFVVLALTFLSLLSLPSNVPLGRVQELPDSPRANNAPALYDAQRLAEEQAYEREVQYAHQQTSGGV